MRGKRHDEETRALVIAALLAGQGVGEVARAYRLDRSTVKNWQRQLRETPAVNPVNPDERAEIGELVTTYLREILATVSVQARGFRDPNWLAKQDASSLALLHGLLCDKGIRLLEAAEAASED